MMRVIDYVGKEAVHERYGRVTVLSAPPRSKAMVNIIVNQRGRGWDEFTESYKRYFLGSVLQGDGNRSLRWRFTHTDQHGVKDTVHINTLTIKQ